MSDSWIPALIGATAALIGVYATQFAAESYRRFRDGSALAAGYVGEMSFLVSRYPDLYESVQTWIQACQEGHSQELNFRVSERESTLFYDETIQRVGMLEQSIVNGVVSFYALAKGFSGGFRTLAEHHKDMTDAEILLRCELLLEALNETKAAADKVLPQLQSRARAGWLHRAGGGG